MPSKSKSLVPIVYVHHGMLKLCHHQYILLPHLFLLDYYQDYYWISTIYHKAFSHIFHFPCISLPTGFQLNLNRITESECNASDIVFLLYFYWSIIQFTITNCLWGQAWSLIWPAICLCSATMCSSINYGFTTFYPQH